MSSGPRVSVVLPIYNGQRYIAEAIESVLAQTYTEYEIIAVNDGSRDQSADIVRRYVATGRVKYLEQANQGVASARNTGISNSSAEFIAFLDQDDRWEPDKLALQVAYMDARPELALVHARVGCIDAEGEPISCSGRVFVDDTSGYCAERLLTGNRIAVLSVLMRRSCLESVGPLNQELAPSDDWDLWLRIAARFPIGFIDAVVAQYRVHDAMESKNLLKMKLAEIRVIESFRATHPQDVRRMNREATESVLIGLYEQAAELLRHAHRPQDAALLLTKAAEMRRRAPWYYLRQASSIFPEKLRRYAAWYWQKLALRIQQRQ